MKTKLFILCIAFLGAAGIACAEEDFPTFDVAIQMPVMNLNGAVGEEPVGVGGRLGYHFSPLLILDGELDYFPENPSGNFGETLGLAGIRIGKEFDRIGVFANVRAGAINFGGGDFSLRLKDKTYPAIDLGGMIEYYSERHLFVRADLGDCIIPFGNTTFLSAYGPKRLGTKHNLLMSFGIGFYF
jgi:hypothetical protein